MTPEKAAEYAAKVLDLAVDDAEDHSPRYVNALIAIADAWMRLHAVLAATGAYGKRADACPSPEPGERSLMDDLPARLHPLATAIGIPDRPADLRERAREWIAGFHATTDDDRVNMVALMLGAADDAIRCAVNHKHRDDDELDEQIDAQRGEIARLRAIVSRIIYIPREPHASEQEGELGRAYLRGWQSVRALIDKALLPEEEQDR